MDILESRGSNRLCRSSKPLVSEGERAVSQGSIRNNEQREEQQELDFSQDAIVFWDQHPGMQPGRITRFNRLDDAIESVMQEPSARTETVAWIRTSNQHFSMDEIRGIVRQIATYSED